MAASISGRGRKRRETLRAAGLRPVQIWVPDIRSSKLVEECRRQSLVVGAADAADRDPGDFTDVALADLDDDG
jgi:hypothetical protein